MGLTRAVRPNGGYAWLICLTLPLQHVLGKSVEVYGVNEASECDKGKTAIGVFLREIIYFC